MGKKKVDKVAYYRELMFRLTPLQVHNHFTDFETDPPMMLFLERFEAALEAKRMNGQLRMLNFTCAEKVSATILSIPEKRSASFFTCYEHLQARKRTLTLTRPSREEPLQFTVRTFAGTFLFLQWTTDTTVTLGHLISSVTVQYDHLTARSVGLIRGSFDPGCAV